MAARQPTFTRRRSRGLAGGRGERRLRAVERGRGDLDVGGRRRRRRARAGSGLSRARHEVLNRFPAGIERGWHNGDGDRRRDVITAGQLIVH